MRHAAAFAYYLACCIRLSSLVGLANCFYRLQVILLLVSRLPVDFKLNALN
jgi:hypothetical protein